MSAESTRAYLARYGLDEKIITYDVLTATVEQAAEASGLEPGQIGKTMAFDVDGDAVLVVCAGDAKVWNSAFKRQFHTKPTFVKPEELEERVGHPMGGVCPFDVKPGVKCYLDVSIRRYDFVRPAAGSENTGVDTTMEELEQASHSLGWVDVCKGWREE
ncbi:YbaK/EbsC family protein [Parafannyhessea umbonata]|uniref:YbaK/EbsC family protein n=1 Tax=Parafannyhessea umbonata TaxID=604330 RepID=A0A6N7X5K9_9ACTN|nr:YbaK/EbsC family protein [Parafannyhessea umbonata]MDD7199355.1 YbaK/EbsC family protein [Parafannyhessea umbonata]MST59522.1 YbaK/EbsC family protein [Parafannyhessea umbonata]